MVSFRVELLATAAVGFTFLSFRSPAQAATYHVAKTGTSTTSATADFSTPSRAFLTVNAGVACLKAGDTLYLHAGEYQEQVFLRQSGAPGAPITIASFPGERALVYQGEYSGPGTGKPHVIISPNAPSSVSHITIERLDIRGGAVGIRPGPGGSWIIRKNRIFNADLHGILGNLTNSVVDGNLIFHNGYQCRRELSKDNQCHGMYINGTNATIVNNIIYNQKNGWGIQIAGLAASLIGNNTFAFIRDQSGIV